MTATTSPEQATTLLPLDTQAPYYKWLVAGIVLMASGTQTFAGNSITLAIPRLMATFGADLAAAQSGASSFSSGHQPACSPPFWASWCCHNTERRVASQSITSAWSPWAVF